MGKKTKGTKTPLKVSSIDKRTTLDERLSFYNEFVEKCDIRQGEPSNSGSPLDGFFTSLFKNSRKKIEHHKLVQLVDEE